MATNGCLATRESEGASLEAACRNILSLQRDRCKNYTRVNQRSREKGLHNSAPAVCMYMCEHATQH